MKRRIVLLHVRLHMVRLTANVDDTAIRNFSCIQRTVRTRMIMKFLEDKHFSTDKMVKKVVKE